MPGRSRTSVRSRAESAADLIGAAARQAESGARLGSREDLRALCGVSVGTLHEALRLLQATGEITVRSGPGGGVFAGDHSSLAGLLRDVRHEARESPDFAQTSRVLRALAPLILHDAIAALDPGRKRGLQQEFVALERSATDNNLQSVVRSSLELFSFIVLIPPTGTLRVVAGTVIRAQIELLPEVAGPIVGEWISLVDQHLAAIADMVEAIQVGNEERAVAARSAPGFDALFYRIHALREAHPTLAR